MEPPPDFQTVRSSAPSAHSTANAKQETWMGEATTTSAPSTASHQPRSSGRGRSRTSPPTPVWAAHRRTGSWPTQKRRPGFARAGRTGGTDGKSWPVAPKRYLDM